jgi:hypothetical protein
MAISAERYEFVGSTRFSGEMANATARLEISRVVKEYSPF